MNNGIINRNAAIVLTEIVSGLTRNILVVFLSSFSFLLPPFQQLKLSVFSNTTILPITLPTSDCLNNATVLRPFWQPEQHQEYSSSNTIMSHIDDRNPLTYVSSYHPHLSLSTLHISQPVYVSQLTSTSGHPHTWAPKHPAKTPWLDHWVTFKNDNLPEEGLDFCDHDLPDDGFSLGDPLDDINHWELPWVTGQRILKEPRSEFKDPAVGDWPGADLSDDETIDLNEIQSVYRGENDQIHSGEVDDNGDEEYCEADYEMATDVTDIIPPLPSPGLRTKTIQFEMFWSNNTKLLDPRPFRVKIWPRDTQEDIEHGIKMFFNLYSTESTKVLMFVDESGVWFSPF